MREKQPSATTNNVPRPVLAWYELTNKERAEFDYLDTADRQNEASFFRYKGHAYDLGDAMRVEPTNQLCAGWDGYYGETFFSAVVVKSAAGTDYVVVGRVYA